MTGITNIIFLPNQGRQGKEPVLFYRQEDYMKKIVMGESQDVVSIDEIDNSSIVGVAKDDIGSKAYIVYSGRNKKRKDRYIPITFIGSFHTPNGAGINKHNQRPYKSIKKAAIYLIGIGRQLYLFDSKRELFEWGLEGLED
jgi:hypothetical protein